MNSINRVLAGEKLSEEEYFLYDKEKDLIIRCPDIASYDPCGINFFSVARLQDDNKIIFLKQDCINYKLYLFQIGIINNSINDKR